MQEIKYFKVHIGYYNFQILSITAHFILPYFNNDDHREEAAELLDQYDNHSVVGIENLMGESYWIDIKTLSRFCGDFYIVKTNTLKNAYKIMDKFFKKVQKNDLLINQKT